VEDLNINDTVRFRNKMSGTHFRAKVLGRINGKKYKLEILESDNEDFVGRIEAVDFGANHNTNRLEFLEVERFEKSLSKWKAAYYFNCCLVAVDTNDKAWFTEASKQYKLWSVKENG
jgi:hypothetical protein